MATVTFGHFPVNMDAPNFLDSALGNFFDAVGTGVFHAAALQVVFPNGGILEFDRTFSPAYKRISPRS